MKNYMDTEYTNMKYESYWIFKVWDVDFELMQYAFSLLFNS